MNCMMRVLFRVRLAALSFVVPILIGLVAGGCGTMGKRGGEAAPPNRDVVRRYFEEWANRGDFRVADELIFPDVELHHPQLTVKGLPSYKLSMADLHKAFPDLRFTIEDQVAEGDRVLVRWTMTGTQRGVFQGQPPTGRKIQVSGMSLFRLSGGRIREIWVSMDRLGFMQQMGLLPAPTNPTAGAK